MTVPTPADRLATLERLVQLDARRSLQFVDLRRRLAAALDRSRQLTADQRLAEVEAALRATDRLEGGDHG